MKVRCSLHRCVIGIRGMACFLAVVCLLLLPACSGSEPDLLLGKWRVYHIDRGGMIIGGPRFKGTEYTFRDNGTVFGQGTATSNQDTLTSRYERRGDTLVYTHLVTQAQEAYHIDSLTTEKLVISAVTDGIPTTVSMQRLKK